ncbi:MAG: hypothetical protein M3505_10410 [Verrucomicrobiota bacterium]|nr:hypothetical protein [Verrucomicrobiota bacterium]
MKKPATYLPMKTLLSIRRSIVSALALICIVFTFTALPFNSLRAHEGHDHGAVPAGPAGEAWSNAQASLKAIKAAAVAKEQDPIHNEQEKLAAALKQIQEQGGGADKARLDGAIKNAIAASEKVHAAADAKDFAKVDSSLKTLEATMAMVEKQLTPAAK